MQKFLSTSHLPGYLIGVLIVALAAWVFNTNARISVAEHKYEAHESLVAHKNTRQDQITELASKFSAHEHLQGHPEGEKKLIAIQTQQAVHTSQLTSIQKQLDRVLDKLDPR